MMKSQRQETCRMVVEIIVMNGLQMMKCTLCCKRYALHAVGTSHAYIVSDQQDKTNRLNKSGNPECSAGGVAKEDLQRNRTFIQ